MAITDSIIINVSTPGAEKLSAVDKALGGVNTSLKKLIDQHNVYQVASKSAMQSAKVFSAALKEQEGRIELVRGKLDKVSNSARQSASVFAAAFKTQAASLKQYDGALASLRKNGDSAYQSVMKGAKAVETLTSKNRLLLPTLDAVAARLEKTRVNAAKLQSTFHTMESSGSRLASTMRGVAFATGAALTLITNRALALGKAAISARGEWESYEKSISAITNSPAEANRAMTALAKNAVVSPYTLKELVGSFQTLRRFIPETNRFLAETGDQLDTIQKISFIARRDLDEVTNALMAMRGGVFRKAQLNPLGINSTLWEQLGIPVDKKGRPTTDPKKIFEMVMNHFRDEFKDLDFSGMLKVVLANFDDAWFQFMAGLGGTIQTSFQPLAARINALLMEMAGAFKNSNVKKAFEGLFEQVLKPAGEKILGWLEQVVKTLKENPQALVNTVLAFTEAVKALFAVFTTAIAGSVIGQIISSIGSLGLILGTAGGTATLLGVVIALTAAFLLVKGKLDDFTKSVTGAKTPLDSLVDILGSELPEAEKNAMAASVLWQQELDRTKKATDEAAGATGNWITQLRELMGLQNQNAQTAQSRMDAFDLGRKQDVGQMIPVQVGSANGKTVRMPVYELEAAIDRKAGGDRTIPDYYYNGLPLINQKRRPDMGNLPYGMMLYEAGGLEMGAGALRSTALRSVPDPTENMTGSQRAAYWRQQGGALLAPDPNFTPDGGGGGGGGTQKADMDKVGESGRKLLIREEGYRTKVYRDSSGYPTVGIGHLLSGAENRKWGIGHDIGEAEVERLFQEDTKEAMDAISSSVTVPLNQNQFDALVSLILNIGVNGFKGSSVLKKLNAGDYGGAAKHFLDWRNAKGTPGILLARRKREVAIFNTASAGIVEPGGGLVQDPGASQGTDPITAAAIAAFKNIGMARPASYEDILARQIALRVAELEHGDVAGFNAKRAGQRSDFVAEQFRFNQAALGWTAGQATASGNEKGGAFMEAQIQANELIQALAQGKPADELMDMATAFADAAQQFKETAPEIQSAMMDWVTRFFEYMNWLVKLKSDPNPSGVGALMLQNGAAPFESFGGGGGDWVQDCSSGQCFWTNSKTGEKTGTNPGAPSGAFNEKAKKEKAPGAGAAKQLDLGAMLIADAINVLTASITGGAEGVKNALAGIASQLLGTLIPGPVGQALGGLVGAFIGGGNKKPPVVQKIIDPVAVFPDRNSLAFASNPASALFGNRPVATGAGFTVTVEYKDGTGDLITTKIANAMFRQNGLDGMLGSLT